MVVTHCLLKNKTMAEKQTRIPMQGTRCEEKGGAGNGDGSERSSLTPAPYQ